MSNILNLPQLSVADSINVTTNADWRDTIQFQFAPPSPNAGQPVDLTGISFRAQLRPAVADPQVLLDLSTTAGTLVVDCQLGTLSFAVPRDQPTSGPPDHMSNLPAGTTCYMDIVASDPTGIILNLCQVAGPMPVTINKGITCAP